MQAIQALVAKQLTAVDQIIHQQLFSRVPLTADVARHIIDAGGKRLRPLLVLLVAELISSTKPGHHTLAAVIEYIHTATLLHDDVVDNSSLRRGKATANAQWGNANSVLVGDFLYSRAFQLLLEEGNQAVMKLLAKTTNTLATGEILQLTKAGNPATSEADYLQIIEDKTAILFAAAAASAGLLSAVSEEQVDALYHYGFHLGIAFQMIDDLLDYQGDAVTMGKNPHSDLMEGKLTLPLIYTLQRGNTEQRALIKQAIDAPSTSSNQQALTAIAHAVNSSGALQYTRELAVEHGQKALHYLQQVAVKPDGAPYQRALQRLIDLAINRQQ